MVGCVHCNENISFHARAKYLSGHICGTWFIGENRARASRACVLVVLNCVEFVISLSIRKGDCGDLFGSDINVPSHTVCIFYIFTYNFDGFACHSMYASAVCLQSHANFRYTSQGGRRTTLRCGFYSVRSWLTGTDFEVRNPQHTHSTKYTHPIGHCTTRIMA